MLQMIRKILAAVAVIAVAAVSIAFIQWRDQQMRRLQANSIVIETAQGPIEYALLGKGPAVLISHGTIGGYDQAQIIAEMLGIDSFQFIAVSRPGYLRTPLSTGETFEAQADAYVALLDQIGIDKVAVIAVSGGGPSALQFALRMDELRGMNISQISFVPGGKIMEVMGRIKDGASHCVELHHRLKNGEVRDVEVFSGPLNYQGKILRYSIAHDITARKRAEEGLRLAMTVFNSIREAVMVTDPENRIIMINPAFTEITGYTAKEVSDENSNFLFSGMHPDAFYLKIWETLQARGEWNGEICDRHKNGDLYHLL